MGCNQSTALQEAVSAAHLRHEPWEMAMNRALEKKTGWTIWNGKVLLAHASKAYKQPITLEEGEPIPFNETSGFNESGGDDYWYEIPLDSETIEKDTGMLIEGRLFTTRMPRGIDLEADEPMSDAPEHLKYKKQGKTDKKRFMSKVRVSGFSLVLCSLPPCHSITACYRRLRSTISLKQSFWSRMKKCSKFSQQL